MSAQGSGWKNGCEGSSASPEKFRASVSKIALTVATALLLSLAVGGCAGLVTSNYSSGNSGKPPTPTPTTQPALTATPTTAAFPNVATGSSSSQTITLQNGGSANVTITSAALSGAGFTTSGLTMPLTIAPGQSSTFNVVFAPGGSGNVTGSLALASNAPGSPLTLTLSGTAVTATRVLMPSTTALSFGDVLLGNSNSQAVMLTNSGNSDVTISSVTVSGTQFSVTGVGANTTLSPGQAAVLNADFSPTGAGSTTGGVVVNSNASAVSISLTGNGVQASTHSVALSWDPSTSDVIGYNVYRAALGSGSYTRLNSAPLAQMQFTDSSVASGQTYSYVVTAVDVDSVESVYSDGVTADVP
jgi:hypothetical protein